MIKTWFDFSKKIFLSQFGQLENPYKLNFIVTKECHSKCGYCNIWKEKPQNELSLEEIIQFVQKNPYFSWVNFTGGEPSDRKDLVEVITAFQKYSDNLLMVHFPTNSLNGETVLKNVDAVIKLNLPYFVVTISLDGPAAVHDRLRGIPGNFNKAISLLKNLRQKEGVKPMVGFTLFPQNADLISETLKEIQALIPDFTPEEMHVNLPQVSAHYYGNKNLDSTKFLEKNKERLTKALINWQKIQGGSFNPMSFVEKTYQRKALEYLRTGETPQVCAALMSSCYLSEKGEVYPCTIWNQKLGSIRETHYELHPLLHSEKAQELRDLILNKKCPNCWTPCEAYQSILSKIA